MSAARLATITSIGVVLVWGAKSVAIGAAGGLGKSPVEGPLFLLGLVLYVVAAPTIGVAMTEGRSTAARVVGAIAGLLAGMALSAVANLVIAPFKPDSDPYWVWEEVNLWIVAVVTASAWWFLRSVRREPVASA